MTKTEYHSIHWGDDEPPQVGEPFVIDLGKGQARRPRLDEEDRCASTVAAVSSDTYGWMTAKPYVSYRVTFAVILPMPFFPLANSPEIINA